MIFRAGFFGVTFFTPSLYSKRRAFLEVAVVLVLLLPTASGCAVVIAYFFGAVCRGLRWLCQNEIGKQATDLMLVALLLTTPCIHCLAAAINRRLSKYCAGKVLVQSQFLTMQKSVGNDGYSAQSNTASLSAGSSDAILSMSSSDFSEWIKRQGCSDVLATALDIAKEKVTEYTLKVHEFTKKKMDLETALEERGAKNELNETEEDVASGEESPTKHGVGQDVGKIVKEIELGTIQAIQVASKNLTVEQAKRLADALVKVAREKKSTVTTLNLDFNEIMDEGVMAVSKVIGNERSVVEKLTLYACGITGVGAMELAGALATNKTVRSLTLSRNSITSGVPKIADALAVNSSLQSLDMYSCGIDCDGATALASALENSALNRLDIVSNKNMGLKGLAHIANALKKNKSLKVLEISDNGINDEIVQMFALALQENKETALKELNLAYNEITQAGADFLVQALKASNNETIENISLRNNEVSSISDERFTICA